VTSVLNHLRRNLVAYVALFVALGGSSYAAFSLPHGSVGTAQLRNGAVTPAKLNRAATPVRAWAVIEATGRVLASSDPVKVQGVSSGDVQLWFKKVKLPRHSDGCSVIATPSTATSYDGSGLVQVFTGNGQGGNYFGSTVTLSVDLVC
jgi:hypothetical protein